jgi:hypothetical protein
VFGILKRRIDLTAAGVLLLAVLVFFGRRAWHGMRFITFGDESMHFVGAQAIQAGAILYRDFIELHGPLAYALPQAYGVFFGWAEPLHARIIPVSLTLAASTAIAASAALRGVWERIMAVAIFLGLITSVWLVQSLCLYDYQPAAGALLLIGFALFVLPAWLRDMPMGSLKPAPLFLAGICLALTPFIAFSYGPAAILFLASGAWPYWRRGQLRSLRALAAGLAAGVAVMLAWMIRYADFRGYLVFHIIHALVDFGPYLQFGTGAAITALWMPVRPDTLGQIIGVAACVAAMAGLVAGRVLRKAAIVPILLGVAGLIMTNPRGSPGFQNGAFMLCAFGFAALSLASLPRCCGVTMTTARRGMGAGDGAGHHRRRVHRPTRAQFAAGFDARAIARSAAVR